MQFPVHPDVYKRQEEDLLTAAVNRAILTGFSTLYQKLVEKEHLVPVTDPDLSLIHI